MCLIFVALKRHPEYPLIVAANRDEFFERPTQALHRWDSGVFAGKDLTAGGTWMGFTKTGRFAALTNYRDPNNSVNNPISRGQLVADFLQSENQAEDYLKAVECNRDRYEGFNLLVGNTENLWYFSNKSEPDSFKQNAAPLAAGIYGLSNHLLDTPWPKVSQGKQAFEETVVRQRQTTETLVENLFNVMNHREQANDELLPNTGVGLEMERYLSPRFITTPFGRYGTRCSTVLLCDKNGAAFMYEKTWNASGQETEFVELTI